ncbi:hypothetical protein CRUP_006077, partial [Coryphaenoides rupestris]
MDPFCPKSRIGTGIVLWTEQQEEELQMLYEEFRDSDDVLGDILKKSTAKRSRARVVDKLISMGLVSERRQLYKKRTSSGVPQKRSSKGSGKSSGKGMTEEEFLADLTGQASDQEEEEEEEEDFSESDEEEIEVQRKSEASANGGPKRKSLGSAIGKVPNVGAMLRALQHE